MQSVHADALGNAESARSSSFDGRDRRFGFSGKLAVGLGHWPVACTTLLALNDLLPYSSCRANPRTSMAFMPGRAKSTTPDRTEYGSAIDIERDPLAPATLFLLYAAPHRAAALGLRDFFRCVRTLYTESFRRFLECPSCSRRDLRDAGRTVARRQTHEAAQTPLRFDRTAFLPRIEVDRS